jgi:predicted RNase H-like nuclease (RuvC/YqgF family)
MNKLLFRISLIAIIYSLTSCQTERKATRFMAEHPNVLAKICDEKFPVIPSVDTFVTIDSILLSQYEREFSNLYYLIDSLISNDSIKTVIQTQIKTVKEPVYKTKTITVTKENTARLSACKEQMEENERDYELNIQGFEHELDESEKEKQELKDKVNRTRKQRNKFMWLLIGMSIFAFRRQIVKLII